MRKRFPVTISLDDGLLSKIDLQRGMISRSIYVENILLNMREVSENNGKAENS